MFEIGWSEILLIAVVALVVFPTKDLPKLFRTVGQTVGKARRMAGDFQAQFNTALREAEREANLLETKETLKSLSPVSDIKKAMNPVKAIGEEIRKQVNDAVTSTPAAATPVQPPAPVIAPPATPSTDTTVAAPTPVVTPPPAGAVAVANVPETPSVVAPITSDHTAAEMAAEKPAKKSKAKAKAEKPAEVAEAADSKPKRARKKTSKEADAASSGDPA